MSLSQATLQAKIEQNLSSFGYVKVIDGGSNKQYSDSFIIAIAKAVVDEIKANAVVNGGKCKDGGAISGGKVS